MTDKKENEPFEVGELVYVTSGSYSDYFVWSISKVLKPFDVKDFTKPHGWKPTEKAIDRERLFREGYLEELASRELWVDYA